MRGSRVLIEVSASTMEVAVCRADTVESRRRIVFDRAEWPAVWTTGLDELKAPLVEAVAALGCAGRPATIIYSLPGTFVAVGACPRAAGEVSALQAARLSLASIATFPLDANPHDAVLLHEDPASSRPRAEAAARAQARIHTIAAADTDANIAALTRWAESGGLKVDSVVPAEGVITAAAAACATTLDASVSDAARAVLWMGAHQSVLAVGSAHRLELVRTIGAGTETLVESLLRPIRARRDSAGSSPRPEAEPVTITMDRAAARRLLASSGIPSAQQPLPELAGCDGASILPLLQPVLQRLAIEIKQSLRFGTNESTKAGLTLVVAGEGASIPNLAEILGRQVGISATSTLGTTAESSRLTCAAALHVKRLPCLLGGEASERMLTRTLRRGLIIGAAAAAILLIVEGASTYLSLNKEQARLAAVKANAAGEGALAMVQQRALNARVASTALGHKISDTLGQVPDWSVVMSVIAERTPPSVRIMNLEMSARTAQAACSLRGYVRLSETRDAPGDIRRFVDSLGQEPIVSSVKLGVTQRANVRGHESQTFELTIGLVSLPARRPESDPATEHAAAAPIRASTREVTP